MTTHRDAAPTRDRQRSFTSRLGRTVTRVLAGLALATVLTFSGAALAGEAGDTVRSHHTEISNLLRQKSSASRDKQVADSLAGLFDYDQIAVNSLEGVYDTLSDDQKTQFKTVLKKLVQKNLEKNIRASLDYDVSWVGEEPSGDNTVVKTKAQSKDKPGEEAVEVDYVLHKNDQGWRAISMVTDGADMVTNFKRQFVRIIKKDGFDTLMKKMNAKLNEK